MARFPYRRLFPPRSRGHRDNSGRCGSPHRPLFLHKARCDGTARRPPRDRASQDVLIAHPARLVRRSVPVPCGGAEPEGRLPRGAPRTPVSTGGPVPPIIVTRRMSHRSPPARGRAPRLSENIAPPVMPAARPPIFAAAVKGCRSIGQRVCMPPSPSPRVDRSILFHAWGAGEPSWRYVCHMKLVKPIRIQHQSSS